MLKRLSLIGWIALALATPSIVRAQALPTATAAGFLQAGIGYTLANPDYGASNIRGVSGFADFDFMTHVGVEAAIHYIAFVTPTDLAENTYVAGPRLVYRKGRFAPYVKVVAGLGSLVIQETQDNPGRYSGNYFMYAFGGGLDIRATDHIIIRAIDVESQKWPSLGNGLSPYVYTVGAAWRFR